MTKPLVMLAGTAIRGWECVEYNIYEAFTSFEFGSEVIKLHDDFKLDYEAMRAQMQPLAKEIAEAVFHPMRIARMAPAFGVEYSEYVELLT